MPTDDTLVPAGHPQQLLLHSLQILSFILGGDYNLVLDMLLLFVPGVLVLVLDLLEPELLLLVSLLLIDEGPGLGWMEGEVPSSQSSIWCLEREPRLAASWWWMEMMLETDASFYSMFEMRLYSVIAAICLLSLVNPSFTLFFLEALFRIQGRQETQQFVEGIAFGGCTI